MELRILTIIIILKATFLLAITMFVKRGGEREVVGGERGRKGVVCVVCMLCVYVVCMVCVLSVLCVSYVVSVVRVVCCVCGVGVCCGPFLFVVTPRWKMSTFRMQQK